MNYKTGGFKQVSEEGLGRFEELSLEFAPEEEGLLMVYTANQTAEDLNVYFDQLTVAHTSGPIIRVDDYYPFGMTFNTGELAGALTNKYLYNGVELQNELGLDLYMTLFRLYDPALGRFTSIDPLADFFPGINPYSFGFDNPILFGDPDGLAPMWWLKLRAKLKQVVYNVTGRGNQHAVINGKNKGQPVQIGAKTAGKNNKKDQNNNNSSTEDIAIRKIEMPEGPQFGEPNLRTEANDVPEPRRDIPEDPKPERSVTKKSFYIDDQEIKGNFQINLNRVLFEANDSQPIGGENTLLNYLSPLAEYMKVNPEVSIQIILTTPVNENLNMKGGKSAQTVQSERLNALREAMQKLGVSRRRIWGEYKYSEPGTQKVMVERK